MKKILCCILFMVMLALGCTACAPKQTDDGTQENVIQFTQTELNLSVGESVQLEVTTAQKNVFIFWSMRDDDIASVDAKGVITALAIGETVCYAEFGGRTAMCLVRVSGKAVTQEISVSVPYQDNQVSLYEGGSIDLKATVKMGEEIVEGATLQYEAEDEAIASVEDGILSAKAIGETTVTIRVSYDGQTASTVVNVQVYGRLS